jgi:hypothetical protein
MNPPTQKRLQQQLRECQEQYDRIKTRIREVGFICEGSLVERWMPCGKPNCRCSTDPRYFHGPYYQLSWKEQGKTVSRRLPPEHARLYKEWIANRRKLESLLRQMRTVSRRAGRHMLRAAKHAEKASTRRASTRSRRPPTT